MLREPEAIRTSRLLI